MRLCRQYGHVDLGNFVGWHWSESIAPKAAFDNLNVTRESGFGGRLLMAWGGLYVKSPFFMVLARNFSGIFELFGTISVKMERKMIVF